MSHYCRKSAHSHLTLQLLAQKWRFAQKVRKLVAHIFTLFSRFFGLLFRKRKYRKSCIIQNVYFVNILALYSEIQLCSLLSKYENLFFLSLALYMDSMSLFNLLFLTTLCNFRANTRRQRFCTSRSSPEHTRKNSEALTKRINQSGRLRKTARKIRTGRTTCLMANMVDGIKLPRWIVLQSPQP